MGNCDCGLRIMASGRTLAGAQVLVGAGRIKEVRSGLAKVASGCCVVQRVGN